MMFYKYLMILKINDFIFLFIVSYVKSCNLTERCIYMVCLFIDVIRPVFIKSFM